MTGIEALARAVARVFDGDDDPDNRVLTAEALAGELRQLGFMVLPAIPEPRR